MRIGHFHAVDFDKDEVVQFFGLDRGIELGHYLSHCCRLTGARGT